MSLAILGDGTDDLSFSSKYGGKVFGLAIDKYVAVQMRVRENFHGIVDYAEYVPGRFEIVTTRDLPEHDVSEATTVGLVNTRAAMDCHFLPPYNLAKKAGGRQAHYFSAFGGSKIFSFHETGDVSQQPLSPDGRLLNELCNHLMLFLANVGDVQKNEPSDEQLFSLRQMTDQGIELVRRGEFDALGRLVDGCWRLHEPSGMDRTYARARLAGAWGGKMTTVGGSRCLLLLAPPKKRDRIIAELSGGTLVHVPFRPSPQGSQVIFSD